MSEVSGLKCPAPAGVRPVPRIEVFTIFPELIEHYCAASVLGRARRAGLLEVVARDLRSATTDPHRSVDDAPFGGGAGMVLAPEPVFAAVEHFDPPRPLLLLSPGGERFDQEMAGELAAQLRPRLKSDAAQHRGGFSLLCGRYEGLDERIAEQLVDRSCSIGDFVLAGGELAALVVIEAVARLVPGVLGNAASATDESFACGLLEHPHYTRPAVFRGSEVPAVLRSGDHEAISAWRLFAALQRTERQRPDLLERRGGLRRDEARLLERYGYPVEALRAATGRRPERPAANEPPEERDLR
jgi:tRNA (guanine37-N1)-methyltransferase